MQRALGWLSRTKDVVVNNAKAQWNERREVAIQTVIAINAFCIYKLLEDHAIRFTMVDGPSMLPALNAGGDIIAAESFYGFRERIQVGDVVLLNSPQDAKNIVCKRVVAMEKDVVKIDRSHPLYNGQSSLRVPRGHVWVEGDNKVNSTDSRVYGSVPLGLVFGRVIFRAWPPSSAGRIEKIVPNHVEFYDQS